MHSTTKSTLASFKTELYAHVLKNTKGKYIAVLSDTSEDRDDERMGKEALIKMSKDTGYVAGLMDHENKALSQVCEWINRQLKEIDGETYFTAEPKFFLDNPDALIIKRMLDDGAKFGISISAMVNDYVDEKVKNKACRTYLDVELLEASFCGIPSNRSGQAMILAKSFGFKREKNLKMENEYSQKDIDSAVSETTKKFESEVSKFKEQLDGKNTEVSDLSKKLTEKDELIKSLETKVEVYKEMDTKAKKEIEFEIKVKKDFEKESETKLSDLSKKLDEKESLVKSLELTVKGCKDNEDKAKEEETKAKEELEKEKKLSLEKMKLANPTDSSNTEDKDELNEVEKRIKAGEVPVGRA